MSKHIYRFHYVNQDQIVLQVRNPRIHSMRLMIYYTRINYTYASDELDPIIGCVNI